MATAYPLWPKQMSAMDAIWIDDVNQLLYGGAAGPGKSYFQRALAFHCANVWPGARIAVFRENFTQLFKTQVWAWWREMHKLGFPIKQHWNQTNAEWHFPNPYTGDTIVEFLHIDPSIGAEKWQSAEWAAIMPDEATQIAEYDLKLLYSRVRANETQRTLWKQLADEREAQARKAGVVDPRMIKRIRSDWRPLAVFATNPGGESHSYFKGDFIDPSRKNEGKPWQIDETLTLDGRSITVSTRRQAIRGKLTDNPAIDPVQYAGTLVHLPPYRREQLLNGDWDYFEGKVFASLDEDIHLVDAKRVFGGKLAPPISWPRAAGLDHGTTSPTAAEWTCRDEDGFFITYLEYYQPGPVGQHIREIKQRMAADGVHDLIFEADPRMWHKTKGIDRMYSVADEYAWGGAPPERPGNYAGVREKGIGLRQAKIERISGRMALQRLLEPDPDLMFPDWHPLAGTLGSPRLFIAQQCPDLWRELNNIRFAEGDSEETIKEDDHAFDAEYRAVPILEQRLSRARTVGPRRRLVAAS
jgi:hypothetical protein